MDNSIFKKLKAKPGMTAALLYAPLEYPDYKDFSDVKTAKMISFTYLLPVERNLMRNL